MKIKSILLFALFVFVLSGYTSTIAQKSSFLQSKDVTNLVAEQNEDRDFIFDELNSPFDNLFNSSLATGELKRLEAIIPDFQVNENLGAGGADQSYPSIATTNDGNFIITWQDSRNGDRDIYAQRYQSDGTAVGGNFRVNDDESSARQSEPAIASDVMGNFTIVWWDDRNRYNNGYYDIYGQRYLNDGTPLGENFKVNDDEGDAAQLFPAIAIDKSGNVVIAWIDFRNGIGIYAQRYLSDGSAMGINFKVDDDVTTALKDYPAISTDGMGNFVLVWQEALTGNSNIYAQYYLNDGTPLGNNFRVNDDEGEAGQFSPSIAMTLSGKFLITWHDERNDQPDIYAQRYSSTATAVGNNFKINDDEGDADQLYPAIAADESGNFVISWNDERDDGSNIYCQRYLNDGTASGRNFKVNDVESSAGRWKSSIGIDTNGNFIIAWRDIRNGDFDIYYQRYLSNGTAIASNFKINDDKGSANQYFPVIAINESGNFMIAWMEYRYGDKSIRDIYAQRYLYNGMAVDSNFKVNDNEGTVAYEAPSIASDKSGNFVIVWSDIRNEDTDLQDIYAQVYLSDGSAVGKNFRVNDDEGKVDQEFPVVAINDSGNFLIVWEDERNGNPDIYAQRYLNDGTLLQNNFKVNGDVGSQRQTSPAIAIDRSGNFMITWTDYRNGEENPDIYAQLYLSEGKAAGSNCKVNSDLGVAKQINNSITNDRQGNFIITWEDYRYDENFPDIYAQHYTSDGTAIGNNFKFDDVEENYGRYSPVIASDKNWNFIMTWRENLNGNYDIYAQRYLRDGSLLGSKFRVTNTSKKQQSVPDVKLWNSRIYNTWEDNRVGGTGYDIWANVLDWDNPVPIRGDATNRLPPGFILYPNYPNPFNSETVIKYQLNHIGFVKLTIFNTLGQKVRTLVSAEQPAANYQVKWDGRDEHSNMVKSGIYFYALNIGTKILYSRRMVMLK